MLNHFTVCDICPNDIFRIAASLFWLTRLLMWYSDVDPWIVRLKWISAPVSSTYTAVTLALLAAGFPIGAPWIKSYKNVKLDLPVTEMHWLCELQLLWFKRMQLHLCHVQKSTYTQSLHTQVACFLTKNETDGIHQIGLSCKAKCPTNKLENKGACQRRGCEVILQQRRSGQMHQPTSSDQQGWYFRRGCGGGEGCCCPRWQQWGNEDDDSVTGTSRSASQCAAHDANQDQRTQLGLAGGGGCYPHPLGMSSSVKGKHICLSALR